MKDATLLTAAPLIGINMMLESTSRHREGGRMFYSATVSAEATVQSPWMEEQTRTFTATATGESIHGAQLKAYAKCVREIAGAGPFPEAFAADIESLEADQP